jgi:hypothetical protein
MTTACMFPKFTMRKGSGQYLVIERATGRLMGSRETATLAYALISNLIAATR